MLRPPLRRLWLRLPGPLLRALPVLLPLNHIVVLYYIILIAVYSILISGYRRLTCWASKTRSAGVRALAAPPALLVKRECAARNCADDVGTRVEGAAGACGLAGEGAAVILEAACFAAVLAAGDGPAQNLVLTR